MRLIVEIYSISEIALYGVSVLTPKNGWKSVKYINTISYIFYYKLEIIVLGKR